MPLHPGMARYDPPMRRAGVYLRISKDRTGEGLAVERQREDGQRLIELRHWSLVREYVDNDLSASGRKKRPGFEEMLHDIEAGVIDTVVALSLDRLSRNRREQLRLVETCQKHRTMIALVRGSDIDLSTAIGRAVADWMAVPARLEIEQKSERHIDQIAQAARHGRMVGGRRAFGYTADGLELVPAEAELVAELYERWLSGEPLNGLTRWLNSKGAKTGQGNVWRRNSVREVLANPRNAGLRGMRDVVNPKTGTRSQWHRIVGPAVWPPIVSEATWRAALGKIRDPGRDGNHRGIYDSTHLLSGIALCGVAGCGKHLVGSRADGRRVLICHPVKHLSRGAERIEAYVEQRVIAHFSMPQGRRLLAGLARGPGAAAVAEARSGVIARRAKLDGLALDYKDNVIDRDQMRIIGKALRAEIAGLEATIAAAGQVDVVAGLLGAVDVDAEWRSYPQSLQREILRRVLRIVVLPGRAGRPGGRWFDPSTVEVTWTPGAGGG
jgi:site-specific DNA recombinase